MNNLRQLILIPVLLILMLGTAAAEQHEGYYLGAYFGVPYMGSVEATDDLGRFNLDTDPGSLYSLTLGYDLPINGPFGNGRVELEYSQREHDITNVDFSTGQVAATGSLQVQSLMLNSFATFRQFYSLVPYVGIGAGLAQVRFDNLQVNSSPLIDDDSLVFTAQGGFGFSKDLTSRLRLDLGYRYLFTQDPELTENDGRKVKVAVGAHTGILGLAFLF